MEEAAISSNGVRFTAKFQTEPRRVIVEPGSGIQEPRTYKVILGGKVLSVGDADALGLGLKIIQFLRTGDASPHQTGLAEAALRDMKLESR